MKALNEKEFLKLIERYESITLDEIKEVGPDQKVELTGFGGCDTCTLCKAVTNKQPYKQLDCSSCLYFVTYHEEFPCPSGMHCINNPLSRSYQEIDDAKTADRLLKAYINRAKIMRKTLELYKNKQ